MTRIKIKLLAGEECEVGFADTCFSAVIEDLHYMVNIKKMREENVTSYTVKELCLALDDSLNCTSDIIDTDCKEQDVFDTWLKAFRSAYHYVCDGTENRKISDILHGIPCWSIEDFVLCVQERAGLPDFSHLLHVDMDTIECEELKKEMSRCKAEARVGSCREQDSVLRTVDGMIRAFFQGTECSASGLFSNNSNDKAPFSAIGIAFQLMIFFLVL